MNESFLPLVGEKQTKFEHEVDKMEVNVVKLLTDPIGIFILVLLMTGWLLLLISACFGQLDQFSRDAYQVVIQIRARSCSYVGFTRDRLGSTGKKTTGAIMIILDSRTRLNFIKLHCTLFFFTRKVSMVIYIEEDWALSRSQNGNWHSITCLCYYAAKTRSRTMTAIAFSRENDAGLRVRTT